MSRHAQILPEDLHNVAFLQSFVCILFQRNFHQGDFLATFFFDQSHVKRLLPNFAI